jgi:glycosyltransferase involved in cell wall biosynthesis
MSNLIGGKRNKGEQRETSEDMPLITVVTVVRNGIQWLEQTILSVIDQTYSNIELIVIDGKSTDGTLELIKKYDDRIDYWISESDNGIYDAMNKGILLAKGKWLNFMNAGDVFMEESTCESMARIMINHDSDVIYGDFIAINLRNKTQILVKARSLDSLWKGMVFSHQSVFTLTEILRKTLFNCKYRLAADYDQFYSLYSYNFRFHYHAVTVSKVIIGGLSYSRNRTIIEQIRISNIYKKLSYRVIYFIYPLFMNSMQSIIGEKASNVIRRLKWKILIKNSIH